MLGSHPHVLSISELFSSLQPGAFPAERVSGGEFWSLLSRPRELWTMALTRRIEPPEFRYPVDAPRAFFNRRSGVPPVAAVCLPAISNEPDRLYAELARVVPRFRPAHVGTHYDRLFSWLVQRFGRRFWIERSGGSLGYVGDIARAFPEAKILHLYRNGCEVAISMSQHPFFRLELLAQRSVRGGSQFDDPSRPSPSVTRFGLRWSAWVVRGMSTLRSLPSGTVRHLAYEELVSQPGPSIREVLKFFGLEEPDNAWVAQVAGWIRPRASRVQALDPRDRERLERVCEVGEAAIREALLADQGA